MHGRHALTFRGALTFREISFHECGGDSGDTGEQRFLEFWLIGADIIRVGDMSDALMCHRRHLKPFLRDVVGLPVLELS